MSEQKERLPLAIARQYAEEAYGLICASCVRIDIAGSIRRKKADCGDIEIVCAPKFEDAGLSLFGEATGVTNLQLARVQHLISEGTFDHRPDKNGVNCCGAGCQRLRYKGFALDIFPVIPPSQYGMILLIRTGSGDFNKRFVLQKAAGGQILQTGMRIEGGALLSFGKMIETPEEADVFKAVGLDWIAPEDRK